MGCFLSHCISGYAKVNTDTLEEEQQKFDKFLKEIIQMWLEGQCDGHSVRNPTLSVQQIMTVLKELIFTLSLLIPMCICRENEKNLHRLELNWKE